MARARSGIATAELPECLAVDLLESRLKIMAVGEPGLFGNDIHGQIGLAQQSFHLAESNPRDFFLGRTLQNRLHAAVESAARHVEFTAKHVDVDSGQCALSDHARGPSDERIIDHEIIRGRAHNDTFRWDQNLAVPR